MMKSFADYFGCCSTRGDYEQLPEEQAGSARGPGSAPGARGAAMEPRRRPQSTSVRPEGISPLPLRQLKASDERAREMGRQHAAMRRQFAGPQHSESASCPLRSYAPEPKSNETSPGSGVTDQTEQTFTPTSSKCTPRTPRSGPEIFVIAGQDLRRTDQIQYKTKLSPKKSPVSTSTPPESGRRPSCLREKRPLSARSSSLSARSQKSAIDSARGVNGDPDEADNERSDKPAPNWNSVAVREVRFTEVEPAFSPGRNLRDNARSTVRSCRFADQSADSSDDSLEVCDDFLPFRDAAQAYRANAPPHSDNGLITLSLLDDAELSPTSAGERPPQVPRLPIGREPIRSSSDADSPVKRKISVCLLGARTSRQEDRSPSQRPFGAKMVADEVAKQCYNRHGAAPPAESAQNLDCPKFSTHLSDFSYRNTMSELNDLSARDYDDLSARSRLMNDPAG